MIFIKEGRAWKLDTVFVYIKVYFMIHFFEKFFVIPYFVLTSNAAMLSSSSMGWQPQSPSIKTLFFPTECSLPLTFESFKLIHLTPLVLKWQIQFSLNNQKQNVHSYFLKELFLDHQRFIHPPPHSSKSFLFYIFIWSFWVAADI